EPGHAGEEAAAEKAELRHAEDQHTGGDCSKPQRQLTLAARRAEVVWVTAADGIEVDRRARGHQRRSSRPIRRWRTWPVTVSITETVMMIRIRMAETSE